MNIIGISGLMGSGKDSVGKLIQHHISKSKGHDITEQYLYATKNELKELATSLQQYENYIQVYSGWKIKKFAGKLKKIASLLTGIPADKFESQEFKNTYMSAEWDVYKQTHECDENNQDGFCLAPVTYREFLQKLGTEAIRTGLHENTWLNSLFVDYKKEKTDDEEYELPKWIITDMRFSNEFNIVKHHKGICVKVENNKILQGTHQSEIDINNFNFDYTINNNGSFDELSTEVEKMLNHYKLI